MCPLRVVLIFLSATLAGFFAWRSFRSAPHGTIPGDPDDGGEVRKVAPSANNWIKFRASSAVKVAGDGLKVFVDMASGKYLWKAMKNL